MTQQAAEKEEAAQMGSDVRDIFIFEEIQMSGVFASEIHHFPARKRSTAGPGGGLPEENFIEFFDKAM
jgi:hypothetical protein